ncbi:acetyl-CoA carboxylase biotin carboxyl carrier protein subunit [Actinokineospora auranticolor]|uniref:Biotin carboxyl carrier protein of acetyl-CoA carboxylase n=1 Tax=Actinokineospora auranticolor TaxID=155976 RepID=A0A2S6GI53_9PSEU|nr:biotin/lipoyl-containing protein [Actinokineospora auranticolor]PPK64899.1 acetyl-CoA carboxylase biotin carboxyl carrier protein [Actinokineospora auranticolor]
MTAMESAVGSPEQVLDAVRANALALCAQSARPVSWIKVTAGEVGVELSFADTVVAVAPSIGPAEVPAPVLALAPRAAEVVAEPEVAVRHVSSPTVGVFYRSPEPGADPFVTEGSVVAPGQQIGIVEAMKLMIPVEADGAGRVVELLVADGTPVEYGEALLAYTPETA